MLHRNMKGWPSMFFSPSSRNPLQAWMDYTTAFTDMTMAASEVILHRTQRIATGTMTPPDALEMVLEKGAAFADASERAAMAAANGGDVLYIMTAALAPYGARTRSNVRKLRK